MIYWEYFQRYHNARLSALIRLAEQRGDSVIPVSLSREGHHGHSAERDLFVDSKAVYLSGDSNVRPIDDPLVIEQLMEVLGRERLDCGCCGRLVWDWHAAGCRMGASEL